MLPEVPSTCGIKGCVGDVTSKIVGGYPVLLCDVASHHRAWLVEMDGSGALKWEFCTRGRSGLKGTARKDAMATSSKEPPIDKIEDDKAVAECGQGNLGKTTCAAEPGLRTVSFFGSM